MRVNLTNAGMNTLLRGISGEQIQFTKISLGNGAAQSAATATGLSNELMVVPIISISREASYVSVGIQINNSQVPAGFRLTEVGIWVSEGEDEESLYALGVEDESKADYISATSETILETKLEFLIYIGDSVNVSAVINQSLVYALKSELQDHIEDQTNPHKVSKLQVGLGEVPNVSTNDQTPTYTAPTEVTTLTSGEKLSTAFGKIAKAISSLIAHIASKGNPHETSPKDIGAANTSHEHSTNDMTSGTLGTSRGGTGKGSWTANRLVYASSSSVLNQLKNPSSTQVLHQDPSGAPYFAHASASEYGRYTGGGKTGSSSPNSIKFAKGVPNTIVIECEENNSFAILMPNAGLGFSLLTGVFIKLVVSVEDSTVKWYYNTNESHPANQMDTRNYKYHYVGLR